MFCRTTRGGYWLRRLSSSRRSHSRTSFGLAQSKTSCHGELPSICTWTSLSSWCSFCSCSTWSCSGVHPWRLLHAGRLRWSRFSSLPPLFKLFTNLLVIILLQWPSSYVRTWQAPRAGHGPCLDPIQVDVDIFLCCIKITGQNA